MATAIDSAQLTLPFGEGGAYPSDEEILGITPDGDASRNAGTTGSAPSFEASVIPSPVEAGARNPSDGAASPGGQRDSSLRPDAGRDGVYPERRRGTRNDSPAAAPEWLQPLLADPRAGREAQALWAQHQAYREMFPSVAEAQQAVARAQQLTALDGAYFGGDARAQAGLAESLYRDDPRAFADMLSAGARVLATRDPAAFRTFAAVTTGATGSAPILGASLGSTGFQPVFSRAAGGNEEHRQNAGATGNATGSAATQPSVIPSPGGAGARNEHVGTAARAELERQRAEMDWRRGEFAAEQYAAFQERANDGVVAQVRQTIEQSLASALPSSVPENARRRIAEGIFSEINTTLQADRELGRQVTTLVQQWRFDDAAREQVVRLIYGRARALVPAVAKRIVGDWTASLVAAQRARAEKQNAAARRADLVGGGAMESVARRPLSPREVDYSQLSDEQILSM